MLRQLFAGKIQQFLPQPFAPGVCRDEQVLDLPGLVAHGHHAVRHVLGAVQVDRPTLLFFFFELRIEELRGPLRQSFFRPAALADSAPPLGKQPGSGSKLLLGFHQPHVLAPLPLGQLGDGVGLAPLLVQLRPAQTGTLPALLPAPGVAFSKDEEIATHDSTGDAMVLVLEGTGQFTVDGKEYILQAGDTLVMPAKKPHSVYAKEDFKWLLTVVFPS